MFYLPEPQITGCYAIIKNFFFRAGKKNSKVFFLTGGSEVDKVENTAICAQDNDLKMQKSKQHVKN